MAAVVEEPAPPACPNDNAAIEAAVATFRETYPYHIQTIASTRASGACETIIVSEPPPNVSPEQIARTLGSATPVQPRRHPIGYDGWATDYAFSVSARNTNWLDARLSALHKLLFATDYKAHTTIIGETPRGISDTNVQMTPRYLREQLSGPTAQLNPVDRPDERLSAVATVQSGPAGVYYVQDAALVVWVLRRHTPIEQHRVDARKFALDSDLILGSVASPTHVAIIGRERTSPTEVVTPVRFETLQTLASARGAELGQSYERNNVLAENLQDSVDWAPIYLSDELIDTEFGSLLNLTDQILKRESMAGQVAYGGFPYPKPLEWPFPKSLIEEISATELTFNWNTHGVGAVAEDGKASVYWVHSTGALPITYLADDAKAGETEIASQRAQAFFARQDDPLLLRVVQYSALYQIFKAFDVRSSLEAPSQAPTAGTILENAANDALKRVTTANEEELKTALIAYAARYSDDEELFYAQVLSLLKQIILLRQMLPEPGDANYDLVLRLSAKALANPTRDFARVRDKVLAGAKLDAKEREVVGELYIAQEAPQLAACKTAVLAFVPDLEAVVMQYARAAHGAGAPVIRTPSIVRSRTARRGMQGGHNIGAKATRVKLTNGVAVAESEFGEVTRMTGINSVDDLAIGANGSISKAPAPSRELYDQLRRVSSTQQRFASRAANLQGKPLQVNKVANGFEVIADNGSSQLLASRSDLVEHLSRSLAKETDLATLRVSGLRPDEVRGLVRSCELKSRREIFAVAADKQVLDRVVSLKRAKIDLDGYRALANNSAEVTFRISGTASGKMPLVARIKTYFSASAVGRYGARIREIAQLAVAKVVARFGSRNAKLTEVALELRRELRRIDGDVSVMVDDLDGSYKATDILIGNNSRPRSQSTRELSLRISHGAM